MPSSNSRALRASITFSDLSDENVRKYIQCSPIKFQGEICQVEVRLLTVIDLGIYPHGYADYKDQMGSRTTQTWSSQSLHVKVEIDGHIPHHRSSFSVADTVIASPFAVTTLADTIVSIAKPWKL